MNPTRSLCSNTTRMTRLSKIQPSPAIMKIGIRLNPDIGYGIQLKRGSKPVFAMSCVLYGSNGVIYMPTMYPNWSV